jgi:hypothetical protein
MDRKRKIIKKDMFFIRLLKVEDNARLPDGGQQKNGSRGQIWVRRCVSVQFAERPRAEFLA